MYTGPNIVKDGLVFGYDTGYGVAENRTATRFSPGEPTTNLITTNLETLGTDGSGQSSVGTRTTIAPNHVRIVDIASNTRQTHLITGLSGGTTYTVSIQFRKLTGTPTFRLQLQDYSGTSFLRVIKFTNTAETGLLDIDGWQTAKWTFTLGSDANAVRIWWQDGADYTTYTHSFELKNPQLEAKGHATPYVSGTRSSTDGLKDFKKLIDIDLNNASFDSTGQPITDGTDDYIVIDGSGSLNFGVNDRFTIETVVKLLAMPTSGNTSAICCKSTCVGIDWYYPSSSGIKLRYGIRNSTNGQQSSESSVVSLNKWYHVVFTYEPNSSTGMKLYVNGEHQSSRSNSGFSEFSNSGKDFYIGSNAALGGGPNKSSIQSAIVKMHNKALSANEINQNFNVYKNRFNI